MREREIEVSFYFTRFTLTFCEETSNGEFAATNVLVFDNIPVACTICLSLKIAELPSTLENSQYIGTYDGFGNRKTFSQ